MPDGTNRPFRHHQRVCPDRGQDGRICCEASAPECCFETFGQGCAGTVATPRLDLADGELPWAGDLLTVELTDLPPSGSAFGLLGFSRTRFGQLVLPFDLGVIGMPGCLLYCGGDIGVSFANLGGRAAWPIAIPTDPAALGTVFYVQGAVVDPGANLLGVVVTNAGEARIGAR